MCRLYRGQVDSANTQICPYIINEIIISKDIAPDPEKYYNDKNGDYCRFAE